MTKELQEKVAGQDWKLTYEKPNLWSTGKI